MSKQLMKGNEALAEAALRAGCRFYSGYPITPQTEILEYLAKRMDEVGGTFVQTESELAGINMLLGASAAGARALTSSAGPGFSLNQEGISYLVAADLPAVIINVMRIGTGLGDIAQGQGDYWQMTRGGGHGDAAGPAQLLHGQGAVGADAFLAAQRQQRLRQGGVRVAGQIDLSGRALCDGSPCLLEAYYLFLCSQLSGHG